MNWISNHFQRYRQRTPWDFCWRITIEGLIVSLVVAVIVYNLGASERQMNMDFWTFLILSSLLGKKPKATMSPLDI